MEDAFDRPVRVVERVIDDQGRVRYQYTGEDATLVVNERGEVFTVWAKSSGGTAGGSGG